MKFRNEYWFLSNMYPCQINAFGMNFTNAEAAFQSQKDTAMAIKFQTLNGKDAKSLGRRVHLRKDWDTVKKDIMYQVIKAKFQEPTLRSQLLATNNIYLVEDNTWGDKYWGVCNGTGRNELGKILMQVRSEIQKETE